MSAQTNVKTTALEITTTTTVEAPTTVIKALQSFDKAESGFKKSNMALVAAAREYGKTSSDADDKVRMGLAAAIAKARGLEIAMVVTSKGGNRSAYQMLSNLLRIARPKEKPEQDAVDNLIEAYHAGDESVTYSDVLKAARPPRGSNKRDTDAGSDNDTDEKAGKKGEKPFTLDTLSFSVGELVVKAIGAEIPAEKIRATIEDTVSETLARYADA